METKKSTSIRKSAGHARINPRLDPAEAAMLKELCRVWINGDQISCQTPSDVVRRCIRESFNKIRRTRKLPEVPENPGDGGGELRRGRVAKDARPYWADQLAMIEGEQKPASTRPTMAEDMATCPLL